ncbi:hypothetical protein EFA46_005370 [Halarchaeum sp. CBA1220]|uniref:Uncharacterized protein n=1 Tax=Halarchaeum grantii TaxID=1193105 RepID=A0A830FCQ7_9EURY|nr:MULTISPECIES: hypothetical protein [Halarchaeum]QLC33651.1 hypothetical protein EFA46_005370 [Halarchaeum sp. CBA1220]GGL33845.1 hypothetical protein GCM10009037_16790 [Halarchaeum grantii]
MAVFFQMVCRECSTSEGEPVTKRPYQRSEFARIQRETHDETTHDGVETATVREFSGDPLGSASSALPRDPPPVAPRAGGDGGE